MIKAEDLMLQYIATKCDTQAQLVLMNHFLGNWEMDLIVISEDGYAEELEIKLSRADYQNDAKKSYSVNGKKVRKHDKIASGDYPCTAFSFLVPRDMISVEEVPDWAGLVYFEMLAEAEFLSFDRVKEPKPTCDDSFWDTCTMMDVALMLSRKTISYRYKLASLREKAKMSKHTAFGE